MFTGIVETVGTLRGIERLPEAARERVVLSVDVGAGIAGDVVIGDSVALDGCCLTVTAVEGPVLSFDAVPETLEMTSIGERAVGDRMNVERALRADARLDGHIVQGHVDGTGRVDALERDGDDVRLRVTCPPEVGRFLVPKGSVAIDGVSLTVVEPSAEAFSVALIPHTLAVTALADRSPGDRVNLEADVLGKYVYRYLDARESARG